MKFFKCASFNAERLDLEGDYLEYLNSSPGGYISILAQDGDDTVAPLIIIDLDTQSIDELRNPLIAYGLQAEIYTSGGKGYHAHIPLAVPLRGPVRDVCYTLKTCVLELVPRADVSIYRPGGIISANGRVHPKTGVPKSLVQTLSGEVVNQPLLVAPPRPLKETRPVADVLMDTVMHYYAGGPQPGERNVGQWQMASDMAAAGIPINAAFLILCTLNKDADYPDDENEIYKAVRSGYRSRN